MVASGKELKPGRPPEEYKTYSAKQKKKILKMMAENDINSKTPLDIILCAMSIYWKAQNLEKAIYCANLAAVYVHPKLSAVAMKGQVELTLSQLIEQSFDKPETKQLSANSAKIIDVVSMASQAVLIEDLF